MSLLANILGFSAFGLAARVGQLMIQKRNILDNPGGHLIAMGVFGYGGYWAYQWDQRAAVLLAEKRQQIIERRQKTLEDLKAKIAESAASK
ncbi:hypothetical protein E4T56_gene9895 [Termitomyces sp. T112]|nr:hypothetical protein E4T56_gene9895 [Termitomyces sp. T112]KAH0585217.1 hypothetical protein H2248_008466 [Termitomyces sp. 'cryptogamus']KNZ81836.1 hypothetical protein J132_10114 [Termitomyces sp. J132]